MRREKETLTGTTAGELALELLHAPSGVHEALLAGKGGMRVHGHVANDDVMIHALVVFGLA